MSSLEFVQTYRLSLAGLRLPPMLPRKLDGLAETATRLATPTVMKDRDLSLQHLTAVARRLSIGMATQGLQATTCYNARSSYGLVFDAKMDVQMPD